MSDTPLHPIVIGPFSVGQFECLGDGLLHEGVGRDQPDTLKDLLVPTKTSKRTPIEDRERPKKWWKAQCIHYGITVPSQASISTYRVHLENGIRQRGGLKRPQEIADLEFEQNAKFRRLNAEIRDATKKDDTKAPKSKYKAVKSKPEPEPEPEPMPAPPKPKAKAEPKAKSESKPKADPKPKAEPKAKAESKAKAKAKVEPEAQIETKTKEPKAKVEPKAKEPKAKAEPKVKSESKSKSKTKVGDVDIAPTKPTTSRKRKAETVVHIYHYDGDNAQGSSTPSIPMQERAKETGRPIKKPRKAAAPSQDYAFIDPPPYSEFEMHPSSSQPLSSQPSFSHPGLSQTIRKGVPGAFSGTYELECTSSEVRRSYQSPILKILIIGNINTSFRALLVLPDFLTCVIRIKPNAPPADDGYVRFEWCGRDDWSKETLPPNPENVGWLKIYRPEGRAKGMIKTPYGEFLFQGPRVDASPVNLQWEWSDFDDNAMDVDGPYY